MKTLKIEFKEVKSKKCVYLIIISSTSAKFEVHMPGEDLRDYMCSDFFGARMADLILQDTPYQFGKKKGFKMYNTVCEDDIEELEKEIEQEKEQKIEENEYDYDDIGEELEEEEDAEEE